MRRASFFLCAVLSGCQSVSEVTPTGRDTYMVGSTARGGFSSDAEVKALAIRRANAFCLEKGLRAEVLSSSNSGVQMWTPQNAEVNFRCVAQ